MIDFHDPDPIPSASPAGARAELLPIHPATTAHFQRLEDLGMTAYRGSVRTGTPLPPSLALSDSAETLPEDGFHRLVLVPRRGPSFVLGLTRTRGLVRLAN